MNKYSIQEPGLRLFSLFGFEVKLDWSWFFLVVLIAWTLATGYFPINFPGLSANTYWIMAIIGAVGLFFSIILHELCHSLVGQYYGISFSGITLFIFGGIANMQDAPSNPKTEFLMSLAGPLFSIVLGFTLNFVFQIGAEMKWPVEINGVIRYLGTINIMLGIFNLLPGFPLDGGRILRSILWWWKSDLKWASLIACNAGVGLAFAMICLGIIMFIQGAFIFGIWMLLLGFFLQNISKISYQDLILREYFQGEPIKKYVKVNPITIQKDTNLQNVIDNYFYKYYYKIYPVLEGEKLIGSISFNEIKQIPKTKWSAVKVSKIMKPCSEDTLIDIETDVISALKRMQYQHNTRLMVTDHGKLYGIITLKDLMDVISIKLKFEGREIF